MDISRIIISGGGTGGHIFPAIAIANEVKSRYPHAEILFIGAEGKMEMEKVPAAGYSIVGLPIRGFQRKLTFSNFLLPFKLGYSLIKAFFIIKKFNPQVVVGVGGYASGPTLKIASFLKIPSLIQEQNSFPGKTNQLLAKSVSKVCVAYEGLEDFFPEYKIEFTGNPVRSEMVITEGKKEEAISFFNLDPLKPTILVIGGSLGARTLNQSVLNSIDLISSEGVQVLWQCGKFYYSELNEQSERLISNQIYLHEFIQRMDLAYAVADVIISRAGAISVSELCIVAKPCVLVPSPNVAEDHQTKNAKALSTNGAAILVKDTDAKELLFETTISLLKNQEKCQSISDSLRVLAKPNATKAIVDTIENIS
jgi:UDP-N-acetylglucosamine--N-acetylmuramyl-(pentapeptide) pyrophosphoryl-undecaprenol N-acetylglucosamine transferase